LSAVGGKRREPEGGGGIQCGEGGGGEGGGKRPGKKAKKHDKAMLAAKQRVIEMAVKPLNDEISQLANRKQLTEAKATFEVRPFGVYGF
jgi:hypothetical protein